MIQPQKVYTRDDADHLEWAEEKTLDKYSLSRYIHYTI